LKSPSVPSVLSQSLAFSLVLLLLVSGCYSGEFELARVSGTVTLDGKPVEGVEVVFAPAEQSGTIEVGPASVGTTDSQGRFSLKTVKGSNGAVVTTHRVSIGYPELDEAAVAAKVDEVTTKNLNMPEQEVLALERKIRRSLANRGSIPEAYNKKSQLTCSVTGSTESANFELSSNGE